MPTLAETANELTSRPTGTTGAGQAFDADAARAQAQSVNDAWDNFYTEDARRANERKPWDLGWKAPDRPTTAAFEGDMSDTTALQRWYNENQETARYQGSNENSNNFTSQSGSMAALGRASESDIMGARQALEDRKKIGQSMLSDTESNYQTRKGEINTAFDQRDSSVAQGMQAGYANVAEIKQKADQSYADTTAKFDELEKMAKDSITWSDQTSRAALNEMRSTVNQQMESVRGTITSWAGNAAKETVAALQAAGYDMNSPQAAAEMRKIQGEAIGKLGSLVTKAQSDYNTLRADTQVKFATIGADVRARAQMSEQAVAEGYGKAGFDRANMYLEASKLQENIRSAGDSERDALAYNRNILLNAQDQLRLSGEQLGADMLTSATQWIPEQPYVLAMANMQNTYNQQNTQDIYNAIMTTMSAIQTGLTAANVGGFGKPETPKTSSAGAAMGLVGDLGKTGASIASAFAGH